MKGLGYLSGGDAGDMHVVLFVLGKQRASFWASDGVSDEKAARRSLYQWLKVDNAPDPHILYWV